MKKIKIKLSYLYCNNAISFGFDKILHKYDVFFLHIKGRYHIKNVHTLYYRRLSGDTNKVLRTFFYVDCKVGIRLWGYRLLYIMAIPAGLEPATY